MNSAIIGTSSFIISGLILWGIKRLFTSWLPTTQQLKDKFVDASEATTAPRQIAAFAPLAFIAIYWICVAFLTFSAGDVLNSLAHLFTIQFLGQEKPDRTVSAAICLTSSIIAAFCFLQGSMIAKECWLSQMRKKD